MPPTFCLLKQHADAFLEKIKSGELDPEKLSAMTSAERRAAFADVVGDANAEHVNAQFESKLLLQNQKAGIQNWIEKTGGLKPEVQRDMLARVARMEKVLEPADLQSFLADLAKQKLGVGVTMEEAGKISELAKATADAKSANNWEDYAAARMAFKSYTDGLLPTDISARQAVIAGNRAFALTWPTTVLKLLGAWSSVITTPVVDAVALGVSKMFPTFAEGAPRYGTADAGVALRAQAAGLTAMWNDGMVDAGRMLRNMPSRLDLLHSERPAVHAWFEYSGSVHGALKEPVRAGEYARSLYRRTAESQRLFDAGDASENPKDVTTMLRNSTAAYKDANRMIFMDDNLAAKTWNSMIQRLERVDKVTGKPNPAGAIVSTALQLEMPIVKAPSNALADASEHIGGLLMGPSRVAWNAVHGLEGLKPVERAAVIRQISKGTVGAALMTLYYFKRDQIEMGGFYQEGEQRKPGDVPAMGMRIGGHDIPKQLGHNAIGYSLQYAATMGKVLDAEQHKTGHVDLDGVRSAFDAATLGLINEVPVIGSLTKDARAFLGAKTVDEFMSKKTASMVSPGVLQWIAKTTDPSPTRAPKGLVQHLEANVPGLRERVPVSKPVKHHY